MFDLLTRRGRLGRHHRDLIHQLDHFATVAGDPEDFSRRADKISTWSVGEQIEHIARIDEMIFQGIERLLNEGGPEEGGPTRPGRVVLTIGRIPRGKGRTPSPGISKGLDAGDVIERLRNCKAAWEGFSSRLDEVHACRARFPHPGLGQFDACQWIRFAQIHVRHHGAIIDDILAA